jgi:dsDNA-specific endonuclease/ATPase MutS2
LGAGTDPEEGSALARALLDHLLRWRITTLATTHYSDLKLYAHSTPGVRNASVEFDIESLRPTYELSIGLPGRSNALAIATRLGLSPAIIRAAELLVRPEALEADSLLQDIKETRRALETERAQAETLRRQVEAQDRDLRYRLSKLEEARRQILNETRQQGLERLEASAVTPPGPPRPGRLPAAPAYAASSLPPPPQVGLELDLRGTTVEEMLPRLERYLDDAYLAMLPWVRIIHGKGTGALRTAVRKELNKHPLVKTAREGEPGEGGDGVTVVYLVEQ